MKLGVLRPTDWPERAIRTECPHLARDFRVLNYDRRGHGRSGRRPGETPRRENEDDLIALIETVHGEPAHVVGNSYGGLVSLAVTARNPEVVRSLSVHEPPTLSLPGDDEFTGQMRQLMATLESVAADIERGELEPAAPRFMEQAALGEGAWALIPGELRALFLATAPAFAAEVRAARWSELEVAGVRRFSRPVLLTKGEASPVWLPRIVDRLAALLPDAATATVDGAGHAPHETHPAEYAELITGFGARAEALYDESEAPMARPA